MRHRLHQWSAHKLVGIYDGDIVERKDRKGGAHDSYFRC